MGSKNIQVGDKFNYLTIIELDSYKKRGVRYHLCKCDCGNLYHAAGVYLVDGRTKSCGCYHARREREIHKTHGMRKTRLYSVWVNMRSRCYKQYNTEYKNYGGRGIKVCDEWKDSFINFMVWAKQSGYDDSLKIDRINNNGNYEPANCKWSTDKEQARNKRTNRMLEYNSEIKSLAEWVDILGLNYSAVKNRINRGWSIQDSLSLVQYPHGRGNNGCERDKYGKFRKRISSGS